MNTARQILLTITLGIIMAGAATTASAQCPPGWIHKVQGISMRFSNGLYCLIDADYCIDPTGTQIILIGYREILPSCPGLPLDQALNEVEKAVIALEANYGSYYGTEPCLGPAYPTTYTISRYLCYKNLGTSLGYLGCPGGTCDKTYLVQCIGGAFLYTLMSGPTKNGQCQPDPGCIPVPCT